MDLFMSMEAFVRAAEAQSFANAARQLGVAKSVVTSRVKQLEDHFGVPLFHRSTRAVRLSELGETSIASASNWSTARTNCPDARAESRIRYRARSTFMCCRASRSAISRRR
jgi:DNA-binding transcriptional LysR family regulator